MLRNTHANQLHAHQDMQLTSEETSCLREL